MKNILLLIFIVMLSGCAQQKFLMYSGNPTQSASSEIVPINFITLGDNVTNASHVCGGAKNVLEIETVHGILGHSVKVRCLTQPTMHNNHTAEFCSQNSILC